MKITFPSVFLSGSAPLVIGAASFLLASAPLMAGTWNGAAGSSARGWVLSGANPYENWADEVNPASTAVIFDDLAETHRDTVGNVVDANITITSLRYMNLGATENDWVVTEIAEGATLTINNGFTVGGYSTGNVAAGTTQAAITGGGKLSITWGSFRIGNNGVDPAIGALDLSGLSEFSYSGAIVAVGQGRATTGYLTLAGSNRLVSPSMRIGSNGGNNASTTRVSIVEMGRSNEFYLQNIYVGADEVISTNANLNRQSGILRFQEYESGPAPTVVIRGTGSTLAVPKASNLFVANMANDDHTGGFNGTLNSTVDFTGGSVDALFDVVEIAHGKNTGGSTTGTLKMDEGQIIASETRLGRTTQGGTEAGGFSTGNLEVAGGLYQTDKLILANNLSGVQKAAGHVEISGGEVEVLGTEGVTMGLRNGTAAEVAASIEITGGSLTVHGNIARGTAAEEVSASVTLDGGLLEMNGHELGLTSLALQSGTLSNLGEYNSGEALVKTTSGVLSLTGTHHHTGETDVSAGTLILAGNLEATSGVTVRDGAELGGSGQIHSGAVVQIEAGGNLALGDGSGTLQIGDLDLQSGSSVSLTLEGTAPGSYGHVVTDGSVSINGANLEITLGFAVEQDQTFTLFSNVSEISGTFATVNGLAFLPGETFFLEYDSLSYQFQLLYNPEGFGTGSDLVLRAIPEPGSLLLLGAGLLFGFGIRKRMKR